MIGPAWLAAIVGVIVLMAALVSAVRMVDARRAHRPTDYQIDLHNVVMGVSMAGMLIPSLVFVTTGPWITAWLVVWIAVTIWFAVPVARHAAQRTPGTRFTVHHLPHLVMSAAMVYAFAVMLIPANDNTDSAMSGMPGMGASHGIVPLATLDYALVLFMVGYAVLVVDRLPSIASTQSLHLVIFSHEGRRNLSERLLTPTTAAMINIVMAITMGYMLTMMF